MKTTLISFVGTGMYKDGYRQTDYVFPDWKEIGNPLTNLEIFRNQIAHGAAGTRKAISRTPRTFRTSTKAAGAERKICSSKSDAEKSN